MANQTVYPFGTDGSLPSSIGIINDLYNGGADKALSAEQGKVLNEEIHEYAPVNISSLTTVKAFISTSTDKWYSSSANYTCKFLSVTPGNVYLIKAQSTHKAYVAVLQSDSHGNNTSPDYATGCSLVQISSGTAYQVTIPADGAYLYIAITSNQTDCAPESVSRVTGRFDSFQDSLDLINSERMDVSSVPETAGWTIGSNGKWASVSADNYSCKLIPITPGNEYIVVAVTTNAIFAVLSSATKSNGGTPYYCTDFPTRLRVATGAIFQFTAPQDAAYLYMSTKTSGSLLDSYVASPKTIDEQLRELGAGALDTKDKFENAPERFAWLKAEQLVKIKWTPILGTIPKSNSSTPFAASTEQTGMIYSSVAEYDKRVPLDVSFHTFMTAIHNKYSLIYTENVKYGSSQSAYGITYYGASNSGAYYGCVCSWLTAYAWGLVPFASSDMDDLVEAGIMEVVYDQSANGARRGDIAWQDGHVMFVKDVWRKNGIVTNVLICELWQPVAREREVMTAAEFNTFLASDRILYRYKEQYKNIEYTPSPYVAVGEEAPQAVTYNDDICTFAGDRAAFAEGDLIYIHCLNLAYPQMELYKGSTLVETITLASDARVAKTSDDLAYAVNLSNAGLTYGKYKCRLKNGDDYSDYTYFEVINATVTLEGNTATYSSENATAVLFYWQRYHDSQGAKIYGMTPLDGKKNGTFETTPPGSTWPLLKVLFQGEYGRVAARFLNQ